MAFGSNKHAVDSFVAAGNIVESIRTGYQHMKRMSILYALYMGGSDAVFNAAVNSMYSQAEKAEIAAVLTDVNTLLTHLEANHKEITGVA